ncbi:mannosylglycoprotein endo-beta-mannosidase [Arachidicoccus rhizosphaerae]|uniref:Mannosylglycoprotein endo-beta-mannosidase n=1 Tax=Arachidicoccus rhizosphaerae TaxID=551991 RepID=A0A1H4BH76_9BACT|nr:sugar-binding domain-containing protein [Arachidicoccus rhizosphaerae]SEA47404.1 mannosylglycoprotein endo-beta-mannosidase [Arachidicoccus rhizosphaerae]
MILKQGNSKKCQVASLIIAVLTTATLLPGLIKAQLVTASLSKPSANESVFLRSSDKKAAKGLGVPGSPWVMQRADLLGAANGQEISQVDYDDKQQGWKKAVVPGTVLNSLVADGKFPDPYYGDNNRISRGLIPDIASAGREFYHYWFRTTFEVPRSFHQQRIWLKFHGINYRSVIWLNGHKLGSMAGMFNSQAFDITGIVDKNGVNALAVDILPVDYTGSNLPPKTAMPGAKGEGQNGGDGEIGKNTTMLMSVGWDFTFPDGVRDRNTGIWKDVELYATGPVQIQNPYVQSKLPLPDTTSSRETISLDLQNSSDVIQKGEVRIGIKELGVYIQKPVTLKARETRQIVLSAEDFPELNIRRPRLWWPIHKGEQHLYQLDLSFVSNDKGDNPEGANNRDDRSHDAGRNVQQNVSHQLTSYFGVRDISTDRQTPDSSRRFLVNGVPIFIRGANWIPEATLKNSVERTFTELRYIHQAGFNLLRLWGGGIAESDYFYHLCDSLGLMVWSEFWITGNTRFPEDTAIYMHNLRSTIQRIRSHASVAYYVSANESTELPGAGQVIYALDSATNYQKQSECCGVHDGSPYTYVNPMQYFENTASKRGSRIDGFNPEYGAPCLPILSSLKEMMPQKDLWPIDKKVWDYMDGGGFHKMTTDYHKAVEEWGPSASIADYVRKAQLVGAMNYRSIMEVWNANKFGYGDRFASGFLFWYINSPEPQVASRLYDWSLEPTAALYYAKNGLEPLHVQFDYLNSTVSVYNDYRKAFSGYTVRYELYDMNSRLLNKGEKKTDIPADGLAGKIMTIAFPRDISPVHFLKLRLLDNKGREVASSFYWRSTDVYKGAWTVTGPAVGGFKGAAQLPKAVVKVRVKKKRATKNGAIVRVNLKNTGSHVAFFIQLQLLHHNAIPVKGALYTDNFISLLPGESREISIEYSDQDAKEIKSSMKLQVSAINMDLKTYTVH